MLIFCTAVGNGEVGKWEKQDSPREKDTVVVSEVFLHSFNGWCEDVRELEGV